MAGKTFTDYKNIIISNIVSNQDLLKALTINDSDFLDKPLVILPQHIPYNYVYPYKVNPEILVDPKTVITMEFIGFKFDGVKFKGGRVNFYTICHESLIRTDYGNRYDYIYEQLKSIFNNNRSFGIGKAIISQTGDLAVSKTQMGNVCSLEISDFGV